jgi:hypothetical protein
MHIYCVLREQNGKFGRLYVANADLSMGTHFYYAPREINPRQVRGLLELVVPAGVACIFKKKGT